METKPEISISAASSVNSENDKSPKENNYESKQPSKPFTYRSWKPQTWQFGTKSWKHHMHESEVEWKIKWTKDCFPNGRVLIIDYISASVLSSGTKKRHVAVASQEFENLGDLQRFYADPKRGGNAAALRVIHVQNCPWATGFFLRKFNIDHDSGIVGMPGFSKWAKYTGPRQRNNKPFPNGLSWREQTDPWRHVSRTAFGLDYLKTSESPDPKEQRQRMFGVKTLDAHMMHMNSYDDGRSPHGYDVGVQRLNVYIQRNLGASQPISPEDQKKNPYAKYGPDGHWRKGDEGKIDAQFLDNSSTVIVFETSASMILDDCLVQPRNELENRWRRLSFYLRKQDVRDDARLAAQCTNLILSDIFHALAVTWQGFLALAQDHVNMLEDKIYENPADESRAPELWENQAAWLKVHKVMSIHQDLVQEMQGHLHDMADVEVDDESESRSQGQSQIEWMSGIPAEYERLAHGVQEDLLQPTANLNDLMYKSVGIRDSRQSLQLGLSMWRLSWITFIFLPLTFIVSFFGMNVDVFAGADSDAYPNIGWYFAAAVILMIFVLALWYCVKHSLERRRQTPYLRGVYEDLFLRLEDNYPRVWSRGGAVEAVEAEGLTSKVKWRLLRRWFAPEKTIEQKLYLSLAPDGSVDGDLGAWARFKRALLWRWLPEIRIKRGANNEDLSMADVEGQTLSTSAPASLRYASGTVTALAKTSAPIAMAEAEPAAVLQLTTMGLQPLSAQREEKRRRSSSLAASRRRYSDERPSSRGSSGVMFEERNLSDNESEAGEGTSSSPGRKQSKTASE